MVSIPDKNDFPAGIFPDEDGTSGLRINADPKLYIFLPANSGHMYTDRLVTDAGSGSQVEERSRNKR